ncbi:DUF1835 domain-containing protein [Inquilinus sp. KBS0705]|nr:DUF1835 domain-containing protein [Inquilinus sp. KBS0705]
MNNTLHILNGDATLTGFEQTGLNGDVLVWREVLSQGPLLADISSAEFWERRSNWICENFSETPGHYHDSVIAPLEKLNLGYNEITLWFEFDLHCQVNMLGVMMLLKQQADLNERAIYLICPNTYPGKDDFAGMGELDGEQLTYLYDNIRLQLSEYDFILAAEAWDVYVSNNADRLKTWLTETTFWGNLHMLQAAMRAHLKRLEVNSDGLNYIHQKLLAIYNSGTHKPIDIYRAFWATEKIYGMGDSELNMYLLQLGDKGLIKLD